MNQRISLRLPAPFDPLHRELAAYWCRIGRPDALPSRRDFDPVDVPRLLPHLWLVDVARDPLRFRFRLIGTAIAQFAGRDSTGKWLDEVYPDYAESSSFERFSRAAAGEPVWMTGPALANPGRTECLLKKLYLPFADDGRTVDLVVCMTTYHRGPAAPIAAIASDAIVHV